MSEVGKEPEIDMESAFQDIYDELTYIAGLRVTAFYGEVAKVIGLKARDRAFFDMLNLINDQEHREGRPLLTAVVVSRGTGIPGSGFFRQASKYGKFTNSGGTDSASFWIKEVNEVWDCWEARTTSERNHPEQKE